MSLPPLPRPRQGNSCGAERDLSETLNYSWGPTACTLLSSFQLLNACLEASLPR